jgi:hypothetical protein
MMGRIGAAGQMTGFPAGRADNFPKKYSKDFRDRVV